jgi:16S rRNA processing protein RimM
MGRETPTTPKSDEVELGSVIGVFSFKGEVRVHLHNPDSELLRQERRVTLTAPDGRRTPATLSVRSGAGQRILGRIAGVDTEEQARALQGYKISISKEELPELESDEYYVWQLQGASVWIGEELVGQVVDVQSPGPTDVLVIERPDGQLTFVPALREFVARVDIAAARVELVAGALDEEPEPEPEP